MPEFAFALALPVLLPMVLSPVVFIIIVIVVITIINKHKNSNIENSVASQIKESLGNNTIKTKSNSTDNKICPYCGSSNPNHSNKCSSCGAKLDK